MTATPLKLLREAVKIFEQQGYSYCLIGGHAASLYRSQARLTKDVDFALVLHPHEETKAAAIKVIKELKLKPMLGFIPASKFEPPRKSVCMITTKSETGKETKGAIDILLPEIPWVVKAVERAQFNRLDLGFAKVPVITPEDLIVAKCYAVRNSPDRYQDLDDLKELLSFKELDIPYTASLLDALELKIPKELIKVAPAGLK